MATFVSAADNLLRQDGLLLLAMLFGLHPLLRRLCADSSYRDRILVMGTASTVKELMGETVKHPR